MSSAKAWQFCLIILLRLRIFVGFLNLLYFIISKKLVPLIRYVGAVFDTPWGPHFGLSLTLNAKPSEVLQRILIKPSMPKEAIEMTRPKAPIKKEVIKCKIARAKTRTEEAAKKIIEHNAKEGIWSAEMLPEIREVNLTLALALALALALTLTSTLTLARCLPRSERTLPQSGRAGRPTFDCGARSAMPQCMVCRGMLTISS